MRQIRRFCLECGGNSPKEVRFCGIPDCPLWLFRLGGKPSTIVKEEGGETSRLFDEANFLEGGVYDPDKEVTECEQ